MMAGDSEFPMSPSDSDSEDALRAANDKFERRYRGMEELAAGRFPELTLDEQEALWQRVKDGPVG